ncbi:MAG: hypothetical protein CM15mV2_2270 [uncultured marine virus]|nr:MAG: hypothetical protein CM15mV2_2270 [uncultured marine virus]
MGYWQSIFSLLSTCQRRAITLSGQVSIRWIENKMNDFLNKILKTEREDYVIASDTDSIYLNLGPLVDVIYKDKEKILKALSRSLILFVRRHLNPSSTSLTKNSQNM